MRAIAGGSDSGAAWAGGDPRLVFLLWAAGFLHVFAAVWNAENGAYNDWDLFALAGRDCAATLQQQYMGAGFRYLGNAATQDRRCRAVADELVLDV